MAKSRAQRKAEQARKRQQDLEERARKSQSQAQHDTEVPISGDVEEFEAALESGAARADQVDDSGSDRRSSPTPTDAEATGAAPPPARPRRLPAARSA